MKLAEQAACVGEIKNATNILVENSKEKMPLGRPWSK
jgi:hypothetical protein